MILLDEKLEKFNVTKQNIDNERNKENLYNFLNEKRNFYFKDQYVNNKEYIENVKKEHDKSQLFLDNLIKGDLNFIKNFLIEQNKVAFEIIQSNKSRTICLMDATGSMSNLLQKSKNTVGIMFERANDIIIFQIHLN